MDTERPTQQVITLPEMIVGIYKIRSFQGGKAIYRDSGQPRIDWNRVKHNFGWDGQFDVQVDRIARLIEVVQDTFIPTESFQIVAQSANALGFASLVNQEDPDQEYYLDFLYGLLTGSVLADPQHQVDWTGCVRRKIKHLRSAITFNNTYDDQPLKRQPAPNFRHFLAACLNDKIRMQRLFELIQEPIEHPAAILV